ncbi:myosin type-2 heavy chain 1 isoform X2 [Cicer arietinum]
MQYLTFVGGLTGSDDSTLEQQVLELNPLQESFGNEKTVRNDNSRMFTARETRVTEPLVAQLCNGEIDVADEAVIAVSILMKLIEFLYVEHSKKTIEFDVVLALIELLSTDETAEE